MKKNIKKVLIIILIAFVGSAAISGIFESENKKENISESKPVEKIRSVVKKALTDEIEIVENGNDFTPSEFEKYLLNNDFNKSEAAEAKDHLIRVLFVANYIKENRKDLAIKNLKNEKFVKNNNLSDKKFTNEEVEDGVYVYEKSK